MNKQIDAKVIIDDTIYSTSNEEDRKYLKEVLHDIGYRKTSAVAMEIFEDVKQLIIQYRKGNISEYRLFIKIEELQQKYESEGADDEQNIPNL